MRNLCLSIAAALLLAHALTGCVTTKDGDRMKQSIIAQEARLNSLQEAVSANHEETQLALKQLKRDLENLMQTSQLTTASGRATLERIDRNLRILNGMIEKTNYDMTTNQKVLRDDLEHIELRVRGLEMKLGIKPPPKKAGDRPLDDKLPDKPATNGETVSAPVPAPVPVAAVEDKGKDETPESFYKRAKNEIRKENNTTGGRRLLAVFLKQYPKHQLADNAQYWIAESYYMDKNYHQAVMEYQKVVDKYPKGDAIDDALYMLGNCFKNLGMKEDARLFYEETIERFPKTRSARVAKDALKSL